MTAIFTTPWGFASIALICFTLVGLAFLGWRIRISRGGGVEVSRDSTPSEIPLLPDKFIPDFIAAVERSGDHQATMQFIKDETLENQMRLYEELSIAGISTMKSGFRALLDESGITYEEGRVLMREFTYILKMVIIDEMKSSTRKWLRLNHFADKTDDEWKTYVELKKTTIKTMVSDVLDRDWFSDAIPRDLIRKINHDYIVQIDEMIVSFFYGARKIAIQQAEKMAEEKEAFNTYVKKLAGYTPCRHEVRKI